MATAIAPDEPAPSLPDPGVTSKATRGLAIPALVIGVTSLVLGLIPFVGFVAWIGGLVAIILGVIAATRPGRRAPAIIGIVAGALAILLGLVISAATVAALTASPGRSTETKRTPAPVVARTVVDASALKDAWVKAGFECPTWNPDNTVSNATTSGTCSDSDVFMVFASASARDSTISSLQAIGGVSETDLLVGPNWIINDPSAADAQPLLGGKVVKVAGSDGASSSTSSSIFDYKTAGLTLTLKTTSKQCFGSAGCNVSVKPVLGVDDPSAIPADATGTVTYTITGDSSGPITGTIDLTGSSYSADETDLSTDSSGTTVSVKITDITTD